MAEDRVVDRNLIRVSYAARKEIRNSYERVGKCSHMEVNAHMADGRSLQYSSEKSSIMIH